jgi:hypothetical protein
MSGAVTKVIITEERSVSTGLLLLAISLASAVLAIWLCVELPSIGEALALLS